MDFFFCRNWRNLLNRWFGFKFLQEIRRNIFFTSMEITQNAGFHEKGSLMRIISPSHIAQRIPFLYRNVSGRNRSRHINWGIQSSGQMMPK